MNADSALKGQSVCTASALAEQSSSTKFSQTSASCNWFRIGCHGCINMTNCSHFSESLFPFPRPLPHFTVISILIRLFGSLGFSFLFFNHISSHIASSLSPRTLSSFFWAYITLSHSNSRSAYVCSHRIFRPICASAYHTNGARSVYRCEKLKRNT